MVPVYDEHDRLHFRIAVQDKEMNKLFIQRMKKILDNEYIIN